MDMRATTCVECIWGAGAGAGAGRRGPPATASASVDGWALWLYPTGAWGRSSLGRRKCKMSLRQDGRTEGEEQRWEKAAMTATRQLSLMERGHRTHPLTRVHGHAATTRYPPPS